MENLEKRGLSPVIATTLLIVLGLVLVMIIILWAKSWIGEKIQKDLGGGAEAIENFCDDVEFVIEVESGGTSTVSVNNIGNIPLYGMDIRKREGGAEESLGTVDFDNGLPKGSAKKESLGFGVNSGDELIAIPVLLGETESYKKPYTCDESFGEIAEVI